MIRIRIALTLTFAAVLGAQAQQPDTARFERRNVMIPMRDGVKLNTEIFIPRGAAERLPILLKRTPYSVPTRITGSRSASSLRRKESRLGKPP